jgi:NCAIR mutase (PurE)-related protein
MRISDYACLDLARQGRTGIPEVVLAEGKHPRHLQKIVETMLNRNKHAIITRASAGALKSLSSLSGQHRIYPEAGMMVLRTKGFRPPVRMGTVGVISAGTSDFRVAEEARIIADQLGCRTIRAYDVGVAGVHRLFKALGRMRRQKVDVYIAVAGREGALPTLVAGMVDAPVIGVPVSTGYGMAGKGKSALYAMLQSCSPLVVVNIDAGFVAGAVAARIARTSSQRGKDGNPRAGRC